MFLIPILTLSAILTLHFQHPSLYNPVTFTYQLVSPLAYNSAYIHCMCVHICNCMCVRIWDINTCMTLQLCMYNCIVHTIIQLLVTFSSPSYSFFFNLFMLDFPHVTIHATCLWQCHSCEWLLTYLVMIPEPCALREASYRTKLASSTSFRDFFKQFALKMKERS